MDQAALKYLVMEKAAISESSPVQISSASGCRSKKESQRLENLSLVSRICGRFRAYPNPHLKLKRPRRRTAHAISMS